MTAPSPFLEASVCRVVALLGLKYGRVTFLDISFFVLEKATCTDSLMLKLQILPADLSERLT